MDSNFSSGAANYMPPFLLGSTDRKVSQVSPTKHSHHVDSIYRSPHGPFEKSTLRFNLTEKDSKQSYAKPPSLRGPPVQGLHENSLHLFEPNSSMSVVSPERRQLNFSVVNESQTSTSSRLDAFTPGYRDDPTKIAPPMVSSPAQIDPFFTRGDELKCDEDYDQCWITVFGFPPTASSYILDQFSQYGSILKHKIVPNSNWIHILYQSKLDAKKALSKNGKVFGKGIMVGVQQCIDKAVMDSDNEHLKDDVRLSSTSGIRPLTAAYQASASTNQVLPSSETAPQKTTGLISKVVEYMFGW